MKFQAKTFFPQLGKAVCYFLCFYGCNLIVSFAFVFGASIYLGVQYGLNGTTPNPDQLSAELMQLLEAASSWLVFGYGALTLLCLFLFFLIRKKNLLREASIARFSSKQLGPVLVIAAGVTLFFNSVLNVMPEAWLESYAEYSSTALSGSAVSLFFATVVSAPLVEEVTFRGLMLSRLKRGGPTWLAVLLTSLAFGLVHGHPLWMAYAGALGLCMAVTAIRCRSTVASFLIHILFNGFGFLMEIVEWTPTMLHFLVMLTLGVLCLIAGFVWLFRVEPEEEDQPQATDFSVSE